VRARNIKPGFYKNDDLAACSVWARLLFPGLWMLADREGRLEDKPKRIKAEVFPYDDVDTDALLDELSRAKVVTRYNHGEQHFIQINNFHKHQRPHQNEAASEIPAISDSCERLATKVESTSNHGDKHFALNPSSLNPESSMCVVSARTDSVFAQTCEKVQKEINSPSLLNLTRIKTLLEQGYDPELDILATIREVMAKRRERGEGPPSSFRFFEQALANARATRLAPIPEGRARGDPKNESDEVAAQLERVRKSMEMRGKLQ